MVMTKGDSLDDEVHRLLHTIVESEKKIEDDRELGDMVRRLIKMHEEERKEHKDKTKD